MPLTITPNSTLKENFQYGGGLLSRPEGFVLSRRFGR